MKDIDNCGITNRGIKELINYSFNSLKNLAIGRNYLGNFGAKLLVKVNIPNLQSLNIGTDWYIQLDAVLKTRE